MTTRRTFVCAAALAPALAALPALAIATDTDPSIIAVRAYRKAHAFYFAASNDEELEARGRAERAAALVALTTVATTPAGLRAFAEFGEWLMQMDETELSMWWPGNGDAHADQRSAEEMYFGTLAKAARLLLPA